MLPQDTAWASVADLITTAGAALDAHAGLYGTARAQRSAHQKVEIAASLRLEVEPAMERITALLTGALPARWGMEGWGLRLAPASGAMTWSANGGKAQRGIRVHMNAMGLGQLSGIVLALAHLRATTTARPEDNTWHAIAGHDHPGGTFLISHYGQTTHAIADVDQWKAWPFESGWVV